MGRLTDQHRRRRGKNVALFFALMGLVVAFYVITIVRFGGE